MKLCADHVVVADDGRNGSAIIGLRDQINMTRRSLLIGVHEISVQAIGSERDTVRHRVIRQHIDRIPAHMRDFQIGVGRRDTIDFA